MSAVLTLTHDEMAIRAATKMRDLAVKGPCLGLLRDWLCARRDLAEFRPTVLTE